MSSNQARVINSKQGPSEIGVWVFVLIDMCIFAMYFWVFAWEKSQNPEQFIQGQATLNSVYGGINTVVLLVSSYFMASAVHAAREYRIDSFQRFIRLTVAGGFIFLVIKAFEYSEKFSAGFHVATNEFYRNYFTFTGFHMLHVIFGLGLLTYLLMAMKSKEQAETKIDQIEGVGIYWHMVDLLWVVLFSLIYLVP